MDVVIVDCSTGKETRRKVTARERAEFAARASTAADGALAESERNARHDRLETLRAKGAAAMTPAERIEVLDLLLGR